MGFQDLYKKMTSRIDGWTSVLTGLGTDRDKAKSFSFSQGFRVPHSVLANAYAESDVVQTITDKVPKTALKQGVVVQYQGEESEEINKELLRLEILTELGRAWGWSRLMGGGAVYMHFSDGISVEEPPDVPVSKIEKLKVFDRRDITPGSAKDLNGPIWYRVTFDSGPLVVHRSRLLLFKGQKLPNLEEKQNLGWGIGVVQRSWEEITAFETVWLSIRNLISDANQGIFKMPGLTQAIANGYSPGLIERMTLLDQTRSVARALLLDEKEDFTRQATNFAGLADLIDRVSQRLAQAAEMPATVLLQRSPAGLNSTGESDIQNWYDTVQSARAADFDGQFLTILKWIALGFGLDPSEISVEWPALWALTEPEKNEVDQGRLTVLTSAEAAGYITKIEARSTWRSEQGVVDDPDAPPVPPAALLETELETDDTVEEISRIDLTYDGQWSYVIQFHEGGTTSGNLPQKQARVQVKGLLAALRQQHLTTPAIAAQLFAIRAPAFRSVGSGYRWVDPDPGQIG